MSMFDNLKEKLTRSIADKIDSVKLNVIDKTSGILGYFIFSFFAIFLLLAVLIFLGIGLSEVLAGAFDSRPAGYFTTAGIYAILIASMFAFRSKIIDFFASVFIRMLTQQDDDDESPDEALK